MLFRDKGRVAENETVVVYISTKDQLWFGINLWIAEESQLLVKLNLINRLGEVVEQFMLTSQECLLDQYIKT